MESGLPRFFAPTTTVKISEIVQLTGAKLFNGRLAEKAIKDIAPIDRAGPFDLTFFENARYESALSKSKAGAIFVREDVSQKIPSYSALLIVSDPYASFVEIAHLLYPDALRPEPLFARGQILGTVHMNARLGEGVSIDPGAVIGPRACIGDGTTIGANAVIGADVRIGKHCSIGACSTVSHCIIGDRVILHCGSHIGQDGFGYVKTLRGHRKVPQIGRVIIEEDVEIGAGSTIDRGGMRDTIVAAGTKIDNLVQIGHNTKVGRHCIIVSQSGLSGSVVVEDYVLLGARVGVQPHMTIGQGAQLSARASVIRNVPAGARWGGFIPAKPMKQFFRETIALERLARGNQKNLMSKISTPQG